MAVTIHQIRPVAHLPLVLGVIRKLQVAALIDTFCPAHSARVLSYGRGVEALLLAILDGHHALYKVGARLEERGMLPLLQDGLARASLNDYRLGQSLDALFAAQLNRVFGAIALRGYPKTFSHCRSEIKQPPCDNEMQGDRRERAYSA